MARWSKELQAYESRGLRRRLPEARPPRGEESALDLGSNDYLGLSMHPRTIEAALEATKAWGTGSGASRLLRGNTQLHTQLEQEIASLKGAKAALVFSSGYAANIGLLTALCSEGDTIHSDRLNHASIVDAARLSRASLHFYEHGDVDHLRQQLSRRKSRGSAWVVTDGVFSMDGVMAPLPELHAVAKEFGATLIIDDAHATGVVGENGSGSLSHFKLPSNGVIQMGTLSKALGSQGGYVAGSRELIEWLVQSARSFIYSTALAPAAVGAAREALKVVHEEPELIVTLRAHLKKLREGLAAAGYEVLGLEPCPMLSVVVGEAETALALANKLKDENIIAPAIRPPTVPKGTSRVRLAPRSDMSGADIDRVLEVFTRLAPEFSRR